MGKCILCNGETGWGGTCKVCGFDNILSKEKDGNYVIVFNDSNNKKIKKQLPIEKENEKFIDFINRNKVKILTIMGETNPTVYNMAKEFKVVEKAKEIKLKKSLEVNEQWEYKIVQFDTKRSALVATDSKITGIDEEINKLGQEGWELVSVLGLQAVSGGLGMSSSGTTTNVAFIFKRRINEEKK